MGAEPHDDVVSSLRDAEAPRRPRAEFEQRLRAELLDASGSLGDGGPIVLELERTDAPPEASPDTAAAASRGGRPRRVLTAAAAAACLLLFGGFLWIGGGARSTDVATAVAPSSTTVEVTTTTPQVATFDLSRALQACDEFAAASFAGRDRLQVVGPNNGAHLATSEEVIDAASVLATALAQLRSDLAAAGLVGDGFERDAARLAALVDRAAGAATSGRWSAAIESLNKAEELLISIDATLTAKGVPQCF